VIIILEGIDGAGKSTLGTAISERFGMPLYTCPRSPLAGQAVEESQAEDRAAVAMAICVGAEVIFDRSFPSEYVYGTALRKREYDQLELDRIDRQVAGVPHLGVLLRFNSPWDAKGRDTQWDNGVFSELDALYLEYVKRTAMRWIQLDATAPVESHVEAIGLELASHRPSKEETYIGVARTVSRRATCLSRRNGAVLVNSSGHVIATGYNGAPKGCKHPTECTRLRHQVQSGQFLDACDDVHAEENAIVQASLSGASPEGGTMYTLTSPCHRCMRMIVNASIARVVYSSRYADDRTFELAKEAGITMDELQ